MFMHTHQTLQWHVYAYTEHSLACSNQTQTARASQNADSLSHRCLSTPTPPPPRQPITKVLAGQPANHKHITIC